MNQAKNIYPQAIKNQTVKDPAIKGVISNPSHPGLYIAILSIWVFCLFWFHPRLAGLLRMAETPLQYFSLIFFIAFVEFAWLYGLYNICIVVFALIFKAFDKKKEVVPSLSFEHSPAVAILYTTYNDFIWESALSCVKQDYENFTVYILDDSTDTAFKKQVDLFAAVHSEKVVVVRRPDRKAFKAGNMNHGLTNYATEESYFAIADADEILPKDFLTKLVPIMESDPACAFTQANHRANPSQKSKLAKDLGIGIDLHWKWYQPLRNKFGFVMFLGHGALLRRSCWEEIGGFPDIVSEDLGFAIRARKLGYRGRFVEDVVCYEDFPDDIRSFRVRHMKWTKGTCEFLYKEMIPLMKSKQIPWMEKLDILFPTLNLPLTFLYLLFMLNANLLIPSIFGHSQNLTMAFGSNELIFPVVGLEQGFNAIFTWDFYLITLLTFIAPVLCFIIGLAHKPLKLFRFLSHSTAIYAALGPLSSIGVFSFALTKKAIFLVTGDKNNHQGPAQKAGKWSLKKRIAELFGKSHPDDFIIQAMEAGFGFAFIGVCLKLMQVSFLGLCFAFILLPILHHFKWKNNFIRPLVYLPFFLIVLGLTFGGMGAFGMGTVFFGYGFHF